MKKVVLLEHTPRFDKNASDPTSLKKHLSKLANSTLHRLLESSAYQDRIFVGQHNIYQSEKTHQHYDLFVCPNTDRYDGIHFYGKHGFEAYTRSVYDVIMNADIQNPGNRYNHKRINPHHQGN